MSIFSDKIVKTKKKHICEMCARKFDAGTEMHKISGVDYGDFFNYYACKTCYVLFPMVNKCGDEEFRTGEIMDYVTDYECKTPEELLEKLLSAGANPAKD